VERVIDNQVLDGQVAVRLRQRVNVHFNERFVFEVRIVSVIRCKNVDELLLLDLIIPVDCSTNSYSNKQGCQNN
jgi:hypothetical protein